MIPINIGLIGKGSIGTFLLKKINEEHVIANTKITAIFDERKKSQLDLNRLAEKYSCEPFYEIDAFLQKDIDLIIECANIEVAKKYATKIVQQKDLLLISIGAMADSQFSEKLQIAAAVSEQKVYLPSGAIGGLDVIKAAKLAGELEAVTLTSRKPATALTDASLVQEKVVFEGSAFEAINRFPKNANVAIALSLAGLGVDKTNVKIIADPHVTKNIHHIKAFGGFGEFEMTIKNNPSPDNPKTSYLTALSILSTLNNLENNIIVGS